MVDWHTIDTVLLDMDGTLVDLRFDTVFWNELLPDRYARQHRVSRAEADARFARYISGVRGTLEYYCIDAWARFTGLPVAAMKRELLSLVRYRPHALELVDRLVAAGKDVRIVTNAHDDSIRVKHEVLAIRDRVPHLHTAHDVGHPKESPRFWPAFAARVPFDASRTMFVDDTPSVLDSARAYGIAHTLQVTQPDTAVASTPARPPHRGVDSFVHLMHGLPNGSAHT